MESCLVEVEESRMDEELRWLQENRQGSWRQAFGRLTWWIEHEPVSDSETLREWFCTEIHKMGRGSQ